MAWRNATATRQTLGDALVALLNSGTLKIRTGAQETNVGDADSGTLLATLTFGATAFGSTNSSGVATANTITSDTDAAASGTAGHGRFYSTAPAIVGDATCGQGTGDISFDNSIIVVGGTVACSSMTMTIPI